MSIEFKCPECGNIVSIEGIDYRLCPICGYSSKFPTSSEIVVHEEVVKQNDGKSILGVIKRGLNKLKKGDF